MTWFTDLLSRLFLHYQSSLTGLAIVLITWLSDHGVTLSEDNGKVLTAKLLAMGIALVKFCSKDKGAPPSDWGDGSFRTGGTRTGIGLLLICGLALGMTGCDWFKGKTTKHQLAIGTANATTALSGVAESIEVFKNAGRISAEAAKGVQSINAKINESIGLIRERAQQGYDKKDLLAIASATSDDILKAEAAGVISFTNERDKQLFRDTVAVAKFTIDTLRQLIELGKTPPPPPAARSLTEEITAIVGIARTVAFDMWRQGRMSESEAFADGAARTSILRDRLAGLTR